MGATKRDHHKTPPRQSLPRACKNKTTSGVYHVESESVYKCAYCGKVVPNRDHTKKMHKRGHYLRVAGPKKAEALEISSGHELDCAICLNPLRYKRMLLLMCKHRFHKKCVVQWFRVDKRCPLCRE